MPNICMNVTIRGSASSVFEAISSARGLDAWWTLEAAGEPLPGASYRLYFGPGYDWLAEVTGCTPDRSVEWTLTRADTDWTGTRVSFRLEDVNGSVLVRFCHSGWANCNDHFLRSTYCWAMYLRLLKRYVERGETVPYSERTGQQ